MGDDTNLLTLLQISDLHFSHRLGGEPVGPHDARLPILLRFFGRFDGLLGHHYTALSALDLFRRSLGDEHVLLSVTGDVTANGAQAQFDLANRFLSAQAPLPVVGLGAPDWRDLSVPGNHDHWPGVNFVLGGPTAALSQYFPGPYPIAGACMQLENGCTLRFILVNSDEEVNPYLKDRIYARGSFVNQLAALSKILSPRPENEIRVLVVHHSMTPLPTQGSHASSGICDITAGTRVVLESFLVDADISVILCGHRHTAQLSHLMPSNGTQQGDTLEARCGTTTQLDKYPYEILKHIGTHRRLPPNTLILHRLAERADGIYWTSQIYWLAKDARFVTGVPHVSSLLPQHLEGEIKVLPRA